VTESYSTYVPGKWTIDCSPPPSRARTLLFPAAKSFFGPWTAASGIVLSVVGLAGSVAPVVPSFLRVRLLAIWFIVVAVQLLLHVHRLTPRETAGDAGSS